jgi:hypothetical protein
MQILQLVLDLELQELNEQTDYRISSLIQNES